MPERRNLEFISEPHTDFVFRVESEYRVVRFIGRLIAPAAIAVMRLWFWLRYHRSGVPAPPSDE
jgi:hypothetical protein